MEEYLKPSKLPCVYGTTMLNETWIVLQSVVDKIDTFLGLKPTILERSLRESLHGFYDYAAEILEVFNTDTFLIHPNNIWLKPKEMANGHLIINHNIAVLEKAIFPEDYPG